MRWVSLRHRCDRAASDLAMLKQQADGLAATLDEIRKRIEGIQAAQPGPEQESD